MNKVIVGISASHLVENTDCTSYTYAKVCDEYVRSVQKANGVPIILPVIDDLASIYHQVSRVDALILSGGEDVNPLLFKQEPYKKIGAISSERDAFDLALIRYARELKKPLLGICRGAQMLNVANGGTLYQDLSYIEGSYIGHTQEANRCELVHSVDIKEGSRLHGIFGASTLVNSLHHLAIDEVARGFVASAHARDGVIEAIECEGEEFILGVQWHPEMLASRDNGSMLGLFSALINAARE